MTPVYDFAVAAAAQAREAAADAVFTATENLREAVRRFRETHPAPPGHVWHEVRGMMRLEAVDDWCSYPYGDGWQCSDPAVQWDADGRGLCERHKEER